MAEQQNKPATNGGGDKVNQSNSTATVTIACKIPQGLILDLTEKGEQARRIRIHGANSKISALAGHGLTEGVPKSFWDEWAHRNRFMDFVKKGYVFAYASRASAVDAARDNDQITGFEPLDPSKAPKDPTKGVEQFKEDAPA